MKIVNKFIQVILSLMTVFAVIMFILLVGVRIIGYTPYVVTSGSMIPQYQVGSLIYVHKVDFKDLKVGDDITFYLSEQSIATHRIHDINEDKMTVHTYGINNKDSNGEYIIDGVETKANDIVGKVDFSLPYLGNIYRYIDTSYGKIAIIGIVIILMGLSYFNQNIIQKWEENESGKEKK